MLPVVPELDRGVDELLSVRARPACVAVVSQQVVLLICTHELTAVLRLVKPLQNIQKNVLVVTDELFIRHVVKQALDVVRRSGAFRDQAVVDQLRAHILKDAHQRLQLVACSLMFRREGLGVLLRVVGYASAV